MATDEQHAASGKLMKVIQALNTAMYECSALGLFGELMTINKIGTRNAEYTVSLIETRETVLPKSSSQEDEAA